MKKLNKDEDGVLKRWMQEFFPYSEFKKVGLFTKEMRGDYKAQAEMICRKLGIKSIYEYGKDEIRCHITYVNPDCKGGINTNGRPLSIDGNGSLKAEPFVTVIKSIWNDSVDAPFIDSSKYDENDDEGDDDGDAETPILPKRPTVTI